MKQVQSTMAGTVFNIIVQEGEEVTVGQTVMILESMKMEIPVEAETAGKIVKVNAQIGDFVNEGDVLVTFE
ncbi:acetyl-CoA carboxylase biotin carboxyl carrier protein subunit [Paenisporosarcina sp. TG-14]|uniref:acetyl-CoA carboxylase biotin carboxyl carrier protein subunit n=1 Tax=Paenisporosarcina sp. TG-14 TaxID=1231057 RepID=UPI0002F46C39|nr:acetyl-CoA carboxylase biotin carboxyl carrier protein subunit [Paenisporosarcina sp. TG-14]